MNKQRVWLAALTLAVGCDKPSDPASPKVVVGGVERVLMHKADHYRLFVREPSNALREIELSDGATFVADVPAGEPMWAEYHEYPCVEGHRNEHGSQRFHRPDAVVHLHSGRNIGGGGWDEGKLGSGMTEVVR